jgi:hypothetical protein
MSRTLILIAGVFAFLSGAQGASAFSTRQVDPVTANDRLADPAELADKMSNGQSGGTSFGLPGGRMTPPNSSSAATGRRSYRREPGF